eukprot:6489713-Amphidinium_carterae.1
MAFVHVSDRVFRIVGGRYHGRECTIASNPSKTILHSHLTNALACEHLVLGEHTTLQTVGAAVENMERSPEQSVADSPAGSVDSDDQPHKRRRINESFPPPSRQPIRPALVPGLQM